MIKYLVYNIETTEIVGGATCASQELYDASTKDPNCGYLMIDSFPLPYVGNYYLNNGELVKFTEQELTWKKNPPQGFIFKMPERCLVDSRSLQEAKDQKWKEIKQIRSQKENATFIFDNKEFQADKTHITGAVQLAIMAKTAGQNFTIDWTLFNNEVISLNADQMIAIGMALGTYISNLYDQARQLRILIENCSTVQEVDSVTWPSV